MNQTPFFDRALPVWPADALREKNVTIGLYAAISGADCLRITTAETYRVFVDGAFFAYGPARCAHDHYRVDEISLPASAAHVAIEVVHYAVNSFCYLQADGFVQAEILSCGQVIAATGGDGFAYFRLSGRVQKVQRYSYQRPFVDAWRLAPSYADWHAGKVCAFTRPITVSETAEKHLVARGIPNYTFTDTFAHRQIAAGTFTEGHIPAQYKKDRSLVRLYDPDSGNLEGFLESELEWHLSDTVQEWRYTAHTTAEENTEEIRLSAHQWALLALPMEKTGFITAHLHCASDTSLWFLFDEVLTDGDVDPLRMDCCNVLRLDLAAGDYDFLSTEPYGFRYLKAVCQTGQVTIRNVGVKELAYPIPVTANYTADNENLQEIYTAAVETFRQNSVDIFMDCPTRERAGWLCDSFFTARTERRLTGQNAIERNFLENYLLPDRFPCLPEGMVPMCYPADHSDGNFIPNWAMWLVLELEDRLRRVGDREFIDRFRPRVYALLDWFAQYENADGLLEKLPGWVFVEWSKANDLVQDINFPSNMLYARMLEAVDTLFGDTALRNKAQRLKETIRRRSYNGSFFTDNEVYGADSLPHSTGECTETCQYYAFYFDVITKDEYADLFERMLTKFGPKRDAKTVYPDVYPSNAIVGNYLRLELLLRYGYKANVIQECRDFFSGMAGKPPNFS